MRYTIFILFSFLLISVSCKQKENQKNTPIKKTGMNTVIKHKKYTALDKSSNEKINNWKAYFTTDEFLHQLTNTTPTEALNNALELKKLTKQLKDSLNIKTLKTPAFKARINVFENEVLRLADMTYIPSISSKEINNQVKKILSLFSSINHKINTVYAKERFDKEIELDSLFDFK